MNIRQLATLVVLLFLGFSVHAASFDCKKAATKMEKTICDNSTLSGLDERLADVYRRVYGASDPSGRASQLVSQRSWLGYASRICGDEECLEAAYDDRIDQLGDLAKGNAGESRANAHRILTFEGLRFGVALNEKAVRSVFHGFACENKHDEFTKLMSSLAHQAVEMCRGKVVFEGQQMDASIELHGNRRLASMTMCYDTPYPEEGVDSTPVSEMEDRLMASYGRPDVLRTESAHQPVQYSPKDLTEGDRPLDWGDDEWVFADGASIVMGWCAGHQKVEGGHVFSAESVRFSSNTQIASVTLPAHHSIPMVLTGLSKDPGGHSLWQPDELLEVDLFAGGKRTCTVGQPVPLMEDGGIARYTTTMTCKDFVQIADTAVNPAPPIRLHIVRNGQELAVGYISASKAIASLQHR